MGGRASGLLFWRIKNLWVPLTIASLFYGSHIWHGAFWGWFFRLGGYDNNKDSGYSINFSGIVLGMKS
jgi:hypothetical protein